MKGFALVLLCALVAVQGRSTAVQKTTRKANLGENPWVVHLRIAVETSGFLNSCTGSLIDNRWVLTAASCLSGSRYIWIRYGVVNVITPTLVTENNQNVVNNDLVLIDINRVVQYEDNIGPIGFGASAFSAESANLCIFGANEKGGPGEALICADVDLEAQEDGSLIIKSDDIQATQFDIGAAVVSNGVQIGVVTAAASKGNAGVVTPVADYLDWIREKVSPGPEVAPTTVKFVN